MSGNNWKLLQIFGFRWDDKFDLTTHLNLASIGPTQMNVLSMDLNRNLAASVMV